MHLALYQPDIPQNVGAFLRLSACLSVPLHIIGPCSFPWDDKKIRRAGMDYTDKVPLTRHTSWEAFDAWRQENGSRLILLTTKTTQKYTEFTFSANDILLMGKESAGVPPIVHETVDHRITIPMAPGMRSLNVAVSAAMVIGEVLRQTESFPR